MFPLIVPPSHPKIWRMLSQGNLCEWRLSRFLCHGHGKLLTRGTRFSLKRFASLKKWSQFTNYHYSQKRCVFITFHSNALKMVHDKEYLPCHWIVCITDALCLFYALYMILTQQHFPWNSTIIILDMNIIMGTNHIKSTGISNKCIVSVVCHHIYYTIYAL